MSGIGVILNPYSKKYKKQPEKLRHMAFIIGDKASYRPTTDIDDLYRVIEDFKSRDIEILAISGGDGTIHCTLTALIKIYGEKPLPRVSLLRGGTLNIIASTMGIKGNNEKLMSKLLIRYHEGPEKMAVKKLRLMKINEEYGCIFGIGFVYRFMEEYYKNFSLSPFMAVQTTFWMVMSALFNGKKTQNVFAPFEAKVMVNGKAWVFNTYTGVLAGSIRQIGLECDAFRHMLTQNEKFHAMGMNLTARELLPHIRKIYFGKPLNCPDVLDEPADTMEIFLNQPMGYTIDGEMLPPTDKFRISVGPEILVLV